MSPRGEVTATSLSKGPLAARERRGVPSAAPGQRQRADPGGRGAQRVPRRPHSARALLREDPPGGRIPQVSAAWSVELARNRYSYDQARARLEREMAARIVCHEGARQLVRDLKCTALDTRLAETADTAILRMRSSAGKQAMRQVAGAATVR